MEVRGLWIGPTFAVLYNTIWYNAIICRLDWDKLILAVKKRKEEELKAIEDKKAESTEDNDDAFKRQTNKVLVWNKENQTFTINILHLQNFDNKI